MRAAVVGHLVSELSTAGCHWRLRSVLSGSESKNKTAPLARLPLRHSSSIGPVSTTTSAPAHSLCT
jgi:hypothetical protein